VNAATLTITATHSSVSVQPGTPGTDTVQVTSNGLLSAPVSFACTGLPSGGTCSFSPSTLQATALPATVTVTFTGSSTVGALAVPDLRGGTPWYSLALVLPGVVFALPRRNRRALRKSLWLVLAIAALAMILGFAGCGGSSSSQSTPQTNTYSVAVTATSGSVHSSAPITVTITQ